MSKYRITLKSGLQSEFSAKGEKELRDKVITGQYGILPIHGLNQENITPENIASLEELSDE